MRHGNCKPGTGLNKPMVNELTMTLTDRLVPFYVWFVLGFGIIAILIGIVNFGMNVVTMFTVKGI